MYLGLALIHCTSKVGLLCGLGLDIVCGSWFSLQVVGMDSPVLPLAVVEAVMTSMVEMSSLPSLRVRISSP